jgi:DNA uptake protein ComE-like DNA-binding protein
MSWKEFFYFQKSDRQVLLVALSVAVVAFGLIFLVGERNTSTGGEATDTDSVPHSKDAGYEKASNRSYYAVEETKPERFVFDPNTADSTQLLRLGLQPWQVRNIYRYRAKGGVFREKTDFARVYGLTAGQYRELEPYRQISSDYRPASEVYGNGRRGGRSGFDSHDEGAPVAERKQYEESPRDTLRYPVKLKQGETIDLNLSDTTQLKKIPGVGSYYARSVVRYRERLGGFYSAGQLLEIENFPAEALAYVTVSGASLRKMNLNRLTVAELRKHPYINFYQAKAIVDYRRLKGDLHSLDDLALLPEFPTHLLERLAPYVTF